MHLHPIQQHPSRPLHAVSLTTPPSPRPQERMANRQHTGQQAHHDGSLLPLYRVLPRFPQQYAVYRFARTPHAAGGAAWGSNPSKLPLLSLPQKANYWIGRNATHTHSKKESTDQATRMQRWAWKSEVVVYPAHWDKMMMVVVVVCCCELGRRGAWR